MAIIYKTAEYAKHCTCGATTKHYLTVDGADIFMCKKCVSDNLLQYDVCPVCGSDNVGYRNNRSVCFCCGTSGAESGHATSIIQWNRPVCNVKINGKGKYEVVVR